MWKNIIINEVLKIERVSGIYSVRYPFLFPVAGFEVRIFEGIDGKYRGRVEMDIKNPVTQEMVTICGEGASDEDALQNTLDILWEFSNKHYPKDTYPEGIPYDNIIIRKWF